MPCDFDVTSEDVYDYLIDFDIRQVAAFDMDYCLDDLGGSFYVLHVDRRELNDLERGYFQYQSLPKLYGLMDEERITPGNLVFNPAALIESGITKVQRPPLNLNGEGVVVCFIDTGINYLDPIFQDGNGESRILAIWDQEDSTGNQPDGFSYGSEYKREDINYAIKMGKETGDMLNAYKYVPSRDFDGHGSAIASVASGSSINQKNDGQDFIGAAFASDIVVVKLRQCKRHLREFYLVNDAAAAYSESDIALAIKYCDSFAKSFSRPIVICLGIGTNMGDHQGRSFLSRYISYVGAKRGRCVVVAGGNEGNKSHHYSSRNVSEDVEINVVTENKGFWLELWGELPTVYTVKVRTPGGESFNTVNLPFGESITYRFVYENSLVTVQTTLAEPGSGKQLIIFRMERPTQGIWTFSVKAEDEENSGYEMWLPINNFLNGEVFFFRPNPDTSVTEPGYSQAITVGAYNSENNSLYAGSGRGYGMDNGIVPDFVAPGVGVSTIDGPRTGSSVAAALTAGAVAQFLQWAVVDGNDIMQETRKIKNYFIRGARRDNSIEYPNKNTGYGVLDIAGVFEVLGQL